jgi:hypothetical protein
VVRRASLLQWLSVAVFLLLSAGLRYPVFRIPIDPESLTRFAYPLLFKLTPPGWILTESLAASRFRPAIPLTVLADVRLYGNWEPGYVISSFVYFAAVALLLFVFLKRLTGSGWLAVLAAGLWALHPLHGVVIGRLTCRCESLMLIGYLLAAIFYLRFAGGGGAGSGTFC